MGWIPLRAMHFACGLAMHLSLGSEWGVGPPKGKASQPVTAAVVAKASLRCCCRSRSARPGRSALPRCLMTSLSLSWINEKRD